MIDQVGFFCTEGGFICTRWFSFTVFVGPFVVMLLLGLRYLYRLYVNEASVTKKQKLIGIIAAATIAACVYMIRIVIPKIQ